MIRLLPLLLVGCSDWSLFGEQQPERPVGNGGTPDPIEDSGLPEDTGQPTDTAPPASFVDCESVGLFTGQWWGSQPFATEPDPVDASGRPFYASDFDLTDQGWSTCLVPDQGSVPAGNDKVYRTTLSLDASGPRVFLDLQSDDGVWVWIDGDFVGHWGGDWQEEGCVNDDANCVTWIPVPAVEVTSRLGPGEHVLAVRLSNPIVGSYMGVSARCVEP